MEKLNLTVENGVQTVELRTGAALPLKEPTVVKINGVLNAPFKWLEKRVKEIDQLKSFILVDREKASLSLMLDESNFYGTTITGKLQVHPTFLNFGINTGNYKTPLEMSEFFKMNRVHFENLQVAMELVTLLKAFKAKVNKDVEQEANLNKGDRKLLFVQTVESNLPPSFFLEIPVFKGYEKERIEVETYFNADDLTCTLVSPMANEITERIKDHAIDEVLFNIQNIAPNIAIIEV